MTFVSHLVTKHAVTDALAKDYVYSEYQAYSNLRCIALLDSCTVLSEN